MMKKKSTKMTKNRISTTALSVTLALALSLTGCGETSPGNATDEKTTVITNADWEETESSEIRPDENNAEKNENTESSEIFEAEKLNEATKNLEIAQITETVEKQESTESFEAIESTEQNEGNNETKNTDTAVNSDTPKSTDSGETSEIPDASAETGMTNATDTITAEASTPTYTYTDLSKTMYAKSSVNVRNLPSTDGNKLGSLTTNQEVTVTGQCNETGWYRILYNNSDAYVSNNYIVNEKVVESVPEISTPKITDSSGHNYYKNLTAEQAAQADAVAKQIADSIMADPTYTSDLERVNAAAQIVAAYSSQCVYGSDSLKWYRSPYGVFIGGVYTCAGSTRALGRVLDFMGFSWQHTNENQNAHQWCILTMDGQTGFADGMGGFAGYGDMSSGMTLSDGTIIFFN